MCKEIHSVGISRTPRWNARNGEHELANHPLRAALISNYLIKICLRRGASYAPFDVFFYFLSSPAAPFPPQKKPRRNGGEEQERILRRSKVDPIRRHRHCHSKQNVRKPTPVRVRTEFVVYHCSNYYHRPLQTFGYQTPPTCTPILRY